MYSGAGAGAVAVGPVVMVATTGPPRPSMSEAIGPRPQIARKSLKAGHANQSLNGSDLRSKPPSSPPMASRLQDHAERPQNDEANRVRLASRSAECFASGGFSSIAMIARRSISVSMHQRPLPWTSPGITRSIRSQADREACFASSHVRRDWPLTRDQSLERSRSAASNES